MGQRAIAIIGTGKISGVHLHAARLAGARLQGVLASSPERSRDMAQKWGATCAYASIEEVMADPAVDVVHICSPNAAHFAAAEAALLAGKHVVCEKPLATTLGDAERLAALATERGLVATVPFVYRYHPEVREARALIQRGELGPLQLIHGSYLQGWLLDQFDNNWRVDAAKGGASRAFADIGSHWCDLVEWITGERFATVIADLRTTIKDRPTAASPLDTVNTEDVACALLRTGSGTLANVVISQVSAGRKNRLWFEIDGAKRSLVFDQESPDPLWLGTRDGFESRSNDTRQDSAEHHRANNVPVGHSQRYAACFEAFVSDTYATIDGHFREGLPTFADGLRSAQIVAAVLQSSKSERWTAIGRAD
ncbi:Gfo/Idh/MocA family protein [Pseudomonas sp. SDO5271_S396]